MCQLGRLTHEQILDDEKFESPQRFAHFVKIRIGLRDIVANDP